MQSRVEFAVKKVWWKFASPLSSECWLERGRNLSARHFSRQISRVQNQIDFHENFSLCRNSSMTKGETDFDPVQLLGVVCHAMMLVGPGTLSSAWAWVWKKAPEALPTPVLHWINVSLRLRLAFQNAAFLECKRKPTANASVLGTLCCRTL